MDDETTDRFDTFLKILVLVFAIPTFDAACTLISLNPPKLADDLKYLLSSVPLLKVFQVIS